MKLMKQEVEVKRMILFAAALLLFLSAPAFCAPVQWSEVDGGNGHWYEVVVNPDPWGVWTWDEAKSFAESAIHEGMQGHLAVVTSQEENDFISSSGFLGAVYGGLFAETIWLGGYQDGSGWQWVTGESWGFEDWRTGQPDSTDFPQYLAMSDGAITPASGWYDMDVDSKFWNDRSVAYIIEYEPVPVPGSMILLGSGLGFLFYLRRK